MGFDLARLVSTVKHELGIIDAVPAGPVPPRLVEAVTEYTGVRVPARNTLIARGLIPVLRLQHFLEYGPATVLLRVGRKPIEEMPAHHKEGLAQRLPLVLDFKAYHMEYASLPKALQTHPIIKDINARVEKLSIIDLYLKFKKELLESSTLVDHYIRTLFKSLGFIDKTKTESWGFFARKDAREIFPPDMFVGINTRGIGGYEALFFGQPLFGYDWSRAKLKTFVDHIPEGGVVGDWGGGKGIFAHELANKRPDLKLHVVDLFSPEEIEDANGDGPVTAKELRQNKNINFLTEDALIATLPDGQKADAIFSGALSPYVKDPLRLLAHMYNQLKVGGILLTSIPNTMIDLTKDWQRARTITEQLAQNLRKLGIAVSTLCGGLIMAIKRSDEREMSVLATLRHAFLGHGLGINRLAQYEAVYEPNLGQWAELVTVDESDAIVPDSAEAIKPDEPLVTEDAPMVAEGALLAGARVNAVPTLTLVPNISPLPR